ncbi:sugar ABC transporter permease [Caballeronia sp. LZ065]|uniref:carbohydrate ABC transporter permease n=1 Tax=Caballeronia sp. LZ065 TaxID=3038571 RepID=UPI002857FB06|nr:sugar ABC transporter permease [Caballeronia sp. LZ065]MDR5780966.1 sugar ABC transporter permease [Caballeronia sp. LZ065]
MNEHETRLAQLTGVAANASALCRPCAQDAGQRRRARILASRWSETRAACLLIAPAVILFGLAVAYPLIDTIRLSFTDMKGLSAGHYIGFGNYEALFQDSHFQRAWRTTLIWTASTTLLSVGAGWSLAMACSLAPKATRIPRVMIFAAYGLSETVTGFIWLGIFRPDSGGLLNAGLEGIGLGRFAHAWLGDPSTALAALVIAYSWAQAGLPLMLCFAATQAIPAQIVEAARMDGAKGVALIRHIVMPLSMPGVRVSTFITLIGSLRAFDLLFVMTNGGPVRSTETLGFFMYRESMTQFKLGYGAAATLVLLATVLLVSIPYILRRAAEAS